jgi:hypothetical protein
MSQKFKVILSSLFVFSFLSMMPGAYAVGPETGPGMDAGAPAAKINSCDFRSDMRKLWEDHITWTRLFIVQAIANHPQTEATTQRLLQNQKDIGNAIKPFYGRDAGNKLTQLLTDHILIAAKIVAAAKAEDARAVEANNRLWFANADEIAVFLNKANPRHWPLRSLRMMMHDHLTLTTNEVVAHLQKNWTADIAAYERVHLEILGMSDTLARGITKQFPKRFSGF